MSCNWNIQDLMGCLKHQRIHYSKVRVGDIVVTDFGPVQVARIEKVEKCNVHRPEPGYHFFDSYENGASGGLENGKEFETHCYVIDRRALNQEGIQAQLDFDKMEMAHGDSR